MKLTRLAITNCSRINDVDIEVRDNLILIGPNGAGKTTVLLCLDMLLGMDADYLPVAVCEDFMRDKAKPFRVEGVFGGLTEEERALFSGTGAAKGESKLTVRLEAYVNGEKLKVSRSISCSDAHETPSQAQRQAFGWTLLREREVLEEAGQQGGWASDDAPTRVDFETGRDGASEAMQRASELLAQSGPADASRSLFVAAVYDSMNRRENVLAIDEPEAHLHPSSQRNLAKLLKLGSSQKVLVTHSPTIAGSFEPDEIVVIRADGTAAQPEMGFLQGEAGMVARWWVGRQLEPLTAGTVIAVEGPSDRIVVNKVASALGFDLDRNDVVVVETEGCGNMKVMESIFGAGGFGIPLFELVDEDNRKDIARRVGADASDFADLAKHHVFVSTRDLEDEYVQAIGAAKLWARIRSSEAFSPSVLKLCRVGADGNPTEEDLAEFIREKTNRKIPSALIAADLIDSANARKVESVANLLKAVSAAI